MDSAAAMLPGDHVLKEALPASRESAKTLTLGPGLSFIPPSKISAVVAGYLSVDRKKNALWIEGNNHGRYVPTTGDLVIVTVHHTSMDFYHCAITPFTPFAMLPQLAFEGATKKARPALQPGSLVYARISSASQQMDPELECIQPATGKSDGLGELKGGMVFEISVGMARKMMAGRGQKRGSLVILEELGDKGLRFEIAVGRNGRVWVDSENIKTTIIIGNAIQETDAKNLTTTDQSRLVKKVLKDL